MANRNEARKRLNSWKEIASFFERDERTVKRWEVERGLPVHRIPGQARSKIYADTDELFEWMKSGTRGPRTSPETVRPAVEKPEPEPIVAVAKQAAEPPARTAAFDDEQTAETSKSKVQVLGRTGRRGRPSSTRILQFGGVGAVVALIMGIGAARLLVRPSPPIQSDPVAAEFYREGLHDWSLRTPVSLAHAVDEFTQTIVREPASPQPYVGLARCYNLLREYSDMPDSEAYPRAEAAVKRALALDPSLADAHSTLAFIRYYWNWDPVGSEQEFKRAMGLAPRDAITRRWYANVLRVEGRLPEALEQITQAQALDPDSSGILADKGGILVSMGRVADGERVLKHLEEVEPQQLWPHAYLSGLYLKRREYDKFLAEARIFSTIKHDSAQLEVIDSAERGLSKGDTSRMFSSMLKTQQKYFVQGLISPYSIAVTYSLLGDRDNTLSWLHRSVNQHDDSVLGALMESSFSFLYKDPQFGFVRTVITGRNRHVQT